MFVSLALTAENFFFLWIFIPFFCASAESEDLKYTQEMFRAVEPIKSKQNNNVLHHIMH